MRFTLRGVSPATSRAPLGAIAPLPFMSDGEGGAEALTAPKPPRLRSFAPVAGPFPLPLVFHSGWADTSMGLCLSGAFPPTAEAWSTEVGAGATPALARRSELRTTSHEALSTAGLACPVPSSEENGGGLPAPLRFPTFL